MQMERVDYDRLRGMLESYSNEQPYLAVVLRILGDYRLVKRRDT